MKKLPSILLEALDELEDKELKKFKFHLSHETLECFTPIPKGQLESADSTDITDKLIDVYCPEGAVKIALYILRKMKKNALAETIKNKMQRNDIPVEDLCEPEKKKLRLCEEKAMSSVENDAGGFDKSVDQGNKAGSSDAAPVQPPAISSSIVVNGTNGNVINFPILFNNRFSEHVSIDLHSRTTQSEALQAAHAAQGHSDNSALQNFLVAHKSKMKKKCECIFEGKGGSDSRTLLEKVYTQLHITEGELKKVNDEHEVLKIDKAFQNQESEDRPINCNEIFSLPGTDEENTLVLTTGIAGIGKTVSVQKFVLDWAEGKSNCDIDCIFLLQFREIKLIEDGEYNIHEFLQEFFPDVGKLDVTKVYEDLKLVFILDGLDERREPLDFNEGLVRSVQKKASVNKLITNLITGNLLPSARIWITSRPAAANQIPLKYVRLFTEVRGFTDEQKEEYFRKKIMVKSKASKIISHVKSIRSLHIMCHIPIFCWMTAMVLQETLLRGKRNEYPTTLTEMYIHFLIIQMTVKNKKYDGKLERDVKKLLELNRDVVLKLAKLAFEQLKKSKSMFYEDDLRECGIHIGEDSECTGMCTEIFKSEFGIHEKKVYCFIHLTVQEFFAALHIFCSYLNKDMDELQYFFKCGDTFRLDCLLKNAVDKAIDNSRDQLDLVLRFLLGISLESNQNKLKGLLPRIESTKESISKVINHIREIQNKIFNLSPEVFIKHLFCLMELKDRFLCNQIKKYLSSDEFPSRELSLPNCSEMAYILLMSGEPLDKIDVKKYSRPHEAWRTLVPFVRCSRRVLLAGCELTESCWETVTSALKADDSVLTELDLSDNYRMQKGMQLLSDGLRSLNCKLEVLRLARCNFNHSGCSELAGALKLVVSRLRELDLSNNNLQDSGVEKIFAGMENPNSNLEILRLEWCKLSEKVCSFFSRLTALRELDLSNNDLQDTGVKLLADGLLQNNSRLEILRLSGCSVTNKGFSSLASSLRSNPSLVLSELDLSYNHPGRSGQKLLSDLLNSSQYKLEKLTMEPKGEQFIRPGIIKYAVQLTFNPDTVSTDLLLSKSNQKVMRALQKQEYPDHQDRFEKFPQVLCAEGLNQRCYWEVELDDLSPDIAVTYPEIKRKNEMYFVWNSYIKLGTNPLSWSLNCRDNHYIVSHDRLKMVIALPKSDRVGVYLDWSSGILSFYNVQLQSHTHTRSLTHIHTFKTVFERPVLAGFAVSKGSLTLCQLDQEMVED